MTYRFEDRIKKPYTYIHSSKTDVAATFRRIKRQQTEEEAARLKTDQVVRPIRRTT